MRTYQWLTLIAAIVITVLEVWLFTGANAAVASQTDSRTAVVMVTVASGDTP